MQNKGQMESARYHGILKAVCKKGSKNGGEGGIRTHGPVSQTLDFESSTIGHSVTSPCGPQL